jgi:multidrug efflux pump subunit AcrA (membrane-fusion protein)
LVTFTVLWLLFRFLKPYRLEALATCFAGVTLLTLLVGPLVRIGRGIHRSGKVPDMKWPRVLTSGGLVLAAALGFLLLPLPLGRIRQVGLLEVRPDAVAPVFVTVPGVLHKLHVREGQHVEAGDLLAELGSLELENQRAAARTEQEMLEVRHQALRELLTVLHDSEERGRMENDVARMAGDATRAARQVELLDEMHQRLQLRAPRAGIVLGLPRIDEVGKFWEKGIQTPFCRVGDGNQLWALVPLEPADYRLLKEDLEETQRGHRPLEVKVRGRGRQDGGWGGAVVQLPEDAGTEVPLALTQKAGGPLLARPGSSPQNGVPQTQQYLVGIAVQAPAGAAWPGGLAQVVIRGRWHSVAWWLWRGLNTTFDLGLL